MCLVLKSVLRSLDWKVQENEPHTIVRSTYIFVCKEFSNICQCKMQTSKFYCIKSQRIQRPLQINVKETRRSNQETHPTMVIRHWTMTNETRTIQKIKKTHNTDHTENIGEPRFSRKVSSSCFIWNTRRDNHIIKFYTSIVGDIGKKNICIKGKNILPFQKYIFRSDHPVPDDVNLGVKQLFEKVASGIIWTNKHVYYD